MKKIKILVLLLMSLFILTACSTLITNNEIYNSTVNVGEITVDDINGLTTTIVTKARDSVIGVSTYQRRLGLTYQIVATGSGVIFECKAILDDEFETEVDDCMNPNLNVKAYKFLAVTNRHVLDKGQKYKVYIGSDDTLVEAKLIKADNKVDLAVIEFEYTRPIQPIEFANSDLVSAGNIAIAIGNPHGHEFWGSATFGIISHPKRYMEDDTDGDGINDWHNEYIQHDVAINPGNSGGALVNAEGKLIGINTLKFVDEETDGMGFAIPSNVVKDLIEILKTGQIPTRITLGITVFPVKYLKNPEEYPMEEQLDFELPEELEYGMYVVDTSFTQLARNFMQDDIILKIAGEKITYSYQVRMILNSISLGDKVEFVILRAGVETVIEVEF